MIPGKAAFLGNMYAFGAMLSFTIAHLAVIRLRAQQPDARPAVPRARATCEGRGRDVPLFAVVGGIGTGLAFVVVTLLHLDVAMAGVGWLVARDASSTRLPPPPGPRPDHDHEGRDPQAGHRARGGVRVGARRARAARTTPRGAMATATKVAARRRRGIHVLVHDHRARHRRRSTPSCPSRSSPPRPSSSRPSSRAAGASPGTGEGAPGPGRAPDRQGGQGDAARRRSSCRCRRAGRPRCSARRWRPCWPSGPAA